MHLPYHSRNRISPAQSLAGRSWDFLEHKEKAKNGMAKQPGWTMAFLQRLVLLITACK
jgi:hypothetical protein